MKAKKWESLLSRKTGRSSTAVVVAVAFIALASPGPSVATLSSSAAARFQFVSADGDGYYGGFEPDGRPRYQGVVYREDPPADVDGRGATTSRSTSGTAGTFPGSILNKEDRPNIVFVLTDDQDVVLEGMVRMCSGIRMLSFGFRNFAIHSPLHSSFQ